MGYILFQGFYVEWMRGITLILSPSPLLFKTWVTKWKTKQNTLPLSAHWLSHGRQTSFGISHVEASPECHFLSADPHRIKEIVIRCPCTMHYILTVEMPLWVDKFGFKLPKMPSTIYRWFSVALKIWCVVLIGVVELQSLQSSLHWASRLQSSHTSRLRFWLE
jgi:hypothetical protein